MMLLARMTFDTPDLVEVSVIVFALSACGCSRREFNIGYDCGREPWAFNQVLSAQLLSRIAAARASLRVTLYPDRDQGRSPLRSPYRHEDVGGS
jgi:hypothetical protein